MLGSGVCLWAPSTEAALCLDPECGLGLLQLKLHYSWIRSVALGSFNRGCIMFGPGVCPWAPSSEAALCLDPDCGLGSFN
ncbi:hypothetical protein DPMN_139198 [Dreissena polymorpha]|uniref:Uncharacterized protein n=1 Tax=Dreissena polymorpha TaxID=45954 RepID=A0A9D4JGA6_DREPO|nr:hypothetical protein DPMN_139198 [Dreissena polymorpha]